MTSVHIVSGTRADYGIYEPVARALIADGWDVAFVLTGMHLVSAFGNTQTVVDDDGFRVAARIPSILAEDTPGNMGRCTALQLQGLIPVLEADRPDWVMLLGDRGEMMAGALAALYTGIPSIHLFGGEISGTIDEPMRHAISKLASLHLTATSQAAERLRRMGEDAWRVHEVGAPRLDSMSDPLPSLGDVAAAHSMPVTAKEYTLLLFHPVVTELADIGRQVREVVEGCRRIGLPIVCVGANADAGSAAIRSAYAAFATGASDFHLVDNFAPAEYLTILKNARVMVGNSSSGIIEAASFHLPVINVGTRQSGRDRSGNVQDVEADSDAIVTAYKRAESPDFQATLRTLRNIYGDGHSAERIVRVLDGLDLSRPWLQKRLAYT